MLALLILVGTAAAADASPVLRVVSLLSDLKAKIISDGKLEQGLYDKYACWCEETTARKASSIEEGKARIEELSKDILELQAAGGVSVATLAKLKKDIQENIEATKAADEIRAKEHNNFIKDKGDLEQNVANLEKAINVLAKGTTGFTPAMVETQTLTIAAGVRSALRLYEKVGDDQGHEDMTSVKSFLSDPAAWVQVKSDAGAPAHLQKYNTQSSVIQGILQEMLDTFKRSQVSDREEEAQKLSDYTSLKNTKKTELQLLESSLTRQTSKEGDDGKTNADSKVEREETETQLRTDEDFFNTMKEGCRAKATQWAERSKVRTDEMSGISQAMDILQGGADKFAASVAVNLLQMSTSHRRVHGSGPRDWAFNALKKAARSGGKKSIQLATLAARVYQKGHFDEVIAEVDAMVKVLRAEEKDDIEHRDFCDTEKSNANSKNEALSYDMTELDNKMARQDNMKTEREAQITKTETEMSQLNTSMAEALTQRNEANSAFLQALKDDVDSIALLGEAITTLAKFYKPALVAAKVQVKAKDEPAGDTSTTVADSAPETFSGDYGGRQSEGGGIVSILEFIKEDLEKEAMQSKKDEAGSLAEYNQLYTDSTDGMNAMAAKVSELNQAVADLDSDMADATAVKLDKESSKNATDTYLTDLAPNCDWIEAQFETRATQRKDELSGLQNAKSILLGAGYEEGGSTGFVAASSSVHTAQTVDSVPSKSETVDDQLRDLDADALSFSVPRSFLQRRR